jgi:hypothetical protein
MENRITRPDWISLTGGTVVAGFIVTNVNQNVTQEQERNPQRISVPNIPGNSVVTVRWVVQGNLPFTVTVDSPKGGMHTKTFR